MGKLASEFVPGRPRRTRQAAKPAPPHWLAQVRPTDLGALLARAVWIQLRLLVTVPPVVGALAQRLRKRR